MTVQAVVTAVKNEFVRLQIDCSQLSGVAFRENCADTPEPELAKLYAVGDKVKARVLDFDKTQRRIHFALKPSLLPQEDGAPLPIAVFGIRQLQTPAFEASMTPWRAIGALDGLCASDAVRPDALLARKYRTWAMEHPDGSELPLTNLDFGASPRLRGRRRRHRPHAGAVYSAPDGRRDRHAHAREQRV